MKAHGGGVSGEKRRPSREELVAARGRSVPDIIAPFLKVLFCGINPGLYSGAVRHHFARPGNRFWPALHAAGFTDRMLSPYEEEELLTCGYGITNLVEGATASADELSLEDLRKGAEAVTAKTLLFKPRSLAVLGVEAFRKAFGRPKAKTGRQDERIGETILWVLPNPSGLNAHYQIADLAHCFEELRKSVEN